ncbi:HD-GYP domain-containing protein, partial [Natronospira bacteriovora]
GDEELKKLRSLCRYVVIDNERGYDGPAFEQRQPPPSAPPVARKEVARQPAPELLPAEPDFRKALTQVYQYRRRATAFLDNVLQGVRSGQSVDTGAAVHVVEGLAKSVEVNINASMWLNSLKRRHEHSANHCTNVAVVSLAFAHYLGYSGQKLIDVGIGALLHDVGLMRLPIHLLDKPGKLAPEEERELREHPTQGEHLLQRGKAQLSSTVVNIIRHHHERLDGSGYPDGLSGDRIPEEAMIVALADIYDAMTTERPYKTPASPHGSMNVIKQLGDREFKRSLVQAFMSCIGIYPIGSVVQLHSGDIALVVSHTRRTRLRPEVMILQNAKGQMYRNWPLMDLDKRAEMRGGDKFQIMRVVDPARYGVDVARVTETYVDRLYQGTLNTV